MDRHPIPRQITTFQFKLIGSLTVKQFAYLLAATAISITIYFLIPVPLINIFLAGVFGAAGAAFSLLTYNDRSLDIWLKNVVIALVAPSQYLYLKNNSVPDFLRSGPISSETEIQTHVDANRKLNAYLGPKAQEETKGREIESLIQQEQVALVAPKVNPAPLKEEVGSESRVKTEVGQPSFLAGVVKDSQDRPLGEVMIYVKTNSGTVSRILKTNRRGVFASFHPLSDGDYIIEPKDLSGRHFFATMSLPIKGPLREPVYIVEKQ